jgi:hypothetical protein
MASAGARYTAQAFVRASSQTRTVAFFEAFYGNDGSRLATLWGQPIVDTATTWTATNPIVGIAPAGSAYVTFGFVFYETAMNELHFVDSASITATTFSPTPIKGPFHTTGNRIYGSNGARITFRGIHRDGSQLAYPRFPSDAEIAQARGWGANFVRVPLNEALWINTCTEKPTNKASYPGLVDGEVRQITSRGMVALLDLHFSVAKPCTASKQQKMADAAFAPTFWARVAARYKANPFVAFDLYNEPHDISDSVWLNGGAVSYGSTTFKAAGMQKLYNAVRGQGAKNLVFISGNNWAARPPAKPVTGSNIVYAVHAYTWDPGALFKNWTTLAANSPVMVTEFGFPDPTSDGAANWKVIRAAEAKGWGWDAFTWDGSAGGTFGLLSSMGSTYEPSPAGMPVLAGLLKN